MLDRFVRISRKNELRPEPTVRRERAPFSSRQSAFTLIELVLVIIIVAVLAAYALPKFVASNSGFEERGFYQETISALRYAQKTAIAQRRLVCVTFTSKTLAVRIASTNPAPVGGCDTDLMGPKGDATPPTYGLDSTSSAADARFRNTDLQYNPVPANVNFNPSGKPTTSLSVTIRNASTGLNFPSTITLEAETGYVH